MEEKTQKIHAQVLKREKRRHVCEQVKTKSHKPSRRIPMKDKDR